EGAAENRELLGIRVPMRRNLVPVRHLETDRKHTLFGWISLEHGKLRTLRKRRGCVPPLELIGREHHRIVAGGCGRLLLCRCRQISYREHSYGCDESQQCFFHDDFLSLDIAR